MATRDTAIYAEVRSERSAAIRSFTFRDRDCSSTARRPGRASSTWVEICPSRKRATPPCVKEIRDGVAESTWLVSNGWRKGESRLGARSGRDKVEWIGSSYVVRGDDFFSLLLKVFIEVGRRYSRCIYAAKPRWVLCHRQTFGASVSLSWP